MEEHPHVHGAACLEDGCVQLVEQPAPSQSRPGWRRPAVLGSAVALAGAAVLGVALSGGGDGPAAAPLHEVQVREPVVQQPPADPAPAAEGVPDRGFDAAVEALTAPREVPAVTGQTLFEAQKALLAEQFVPQAVDGSGQGRVPVLSSGWTVVAQEPAPGTVLPPGRRVTLTVQRR